MLVSFIGNDVGWRMGMADGKEGFAFGDGGVSEFSCCPSLILVQRDRASPATEPLPRDGGVRGWCMARPVYVAS